jgi:multisubunit Na+/H+ antiporter MnhG subunit
MNGIRFYLEFTDKSKRQSGGTVVAVLALNGCHWSSGKLCYEAIAALFEQSNSPVASTGVALNYLRQHCRRISEAKARTIHPALFERLDQP